MLKLISNYSLLCYYIKCKRVLHTSIIFPIYNFPVARVVKQKFRHKYPLHMCVCVCADGRITQSGRIANELLLYIYNREENRMCVCAPVVVGIFAKCK